MKHTATCTVTFTVEDDDSIDVRDAAEAYLNSMMEEVFNENMATGANIVVGYAVTEVK